MQVGVAFAEKFVTTKPYPYPITGSVRQEVFTRRGGLYFGIAHLLDYPASYAHIYRFADFNAGQYAEPKRRFQFALTQVSGIPLVLDGDLLRYDGERPLREPGSTELATRALAQRLQLSDRQIRDDLELGKTSAFGQSELYVRVFALADRMAAKPVPRATLPQITLQSPKITRKLTTEWFAERVQGRYDACLARIGS
jgi:hypothetical protein